MSILDEEEDRFAGKVRRTAKGQPYILANPDWSDDEAHARGFREHAAEPRGLSKLYVRCTTYVSCLEDTYALGQWQERMVVRGMVESPPLIAAAQRIDYNNENEAYDSLNEIAAKAKDVARWKEKADMGTDFHDIARQWDLGRRDWPHLSEASRAMLRAYIAETEGWEYGLIEQGLVNDDNCSFGTPDRARHRTRQEDEGEAGRLGWSPEMGAPRHKLRITDIKTGRIDFGKPKMALQTANYAASKHYDPDTGIRTDLDIDLEVAEIVHVPYGEGTCSVYPVPLAVPLAALNGLIPRVRQFRARREWFGPAYGSTLRVENTHGKVTELESGVAAAWSSQPPEAF